ncbi:hypothetical protein QNM97_16070 [Gordonia sp. L191]|uniref:hypothetical protein n=1 Tax=Gordonia sp. L191 TaxID=2982699 RepID=UPI0024BF578C|nr:hypothetical protein [Gordonia sp. L191]WHU45535.1 hypothetical protein QNM97_16070 [Gordonia sp. L191]
MGLGDSVAREGGDHPDDAQHDADPAQHDPGLGLAVPAGGFGLRLTTMIAGIPVIRPGQKIETIPGTKLTVAFVFFCTGLMTFMN